MIFVSFHLYSESSGHFRGGFRDSGRVLQVSRWFGSFFDDFGAFCLGLEILRGFWAFLEFLARVRSNPEVRSHQWDVFRFLCTNPESHRRLRSPVRSFMIFGDFDFIPMSFSHLITFINKNLVL